MIFVFDLLHRYISLNIHDITKFPDKARNLFVTDTFYYFLIMLNYLVAGSKKCNNWRSRRFSRPGGWTKFSGAAGRFFTVSVIREVPVIGDTWGLFWPHDCGRNLVVNKLRLMVSDVMEWLAWWPDCHRLQLNTLWNEVSTGWALEDQFNQRTVLPWKITIDT